MPELPDVAVYKSYLDAISLHKLIDEVIVNDDKVPEESVKAKVPSVVESAI